MTPTGQAEVQWLFILPDGPALISSPRGLYAGHPTSIAVAFMKDRQKTRTVPISAQPGSWAPRCRKL